MIWKKLRTISIEIHVSDKLNDFKYVSVTSQFFFLFLIWNFQANVQSWLPLKRLNNKKNVNNLQQNIILYVSLQIIGRLLEINFQSKNNFHLNRCYFINSLCIASWETINVSKNLWLRYIYIRRRVKSLQMISVDILKKISNQRN